jgi:hypothetical protein
VFAVLAAGTNIWHWSPAHCCRQRHDRCFALPQRLKDALASCTPKGRCTVGWIVSRGGRESWDVWLEVSTELVKLIPPANSWSGARRVRVS